MLTRRAEIRAYLLELLRRSAGKRRPITDDTLVYHDLHIWGDDAYELLKAMAKRFPIPDGSIVFDRYFQCEGSVGSFWMLLRWLGIKDGTKASLRVADLVELFERGRLSETRT